MDGQGVAREKEGLRWMVRVWRRTGEGADLGLIGLEGGAGASSATNGWRFRSVVAAGKVNLFSIMAGK